MPVLTTAGDPGPRVAGPSNEASPPQTAKRGPAEATAGPLGYRSAATEGGYGAATWVAWPTSARGTSPTTSTPAARLMSTALITEPY
jgi:hypothetical protein